VYAINPYEIPRAHWKWAGIKEPPVKPVHPVWLQTILRECHRSSQRSHQKKKPVCSPLQPKNKNVLKKQSVLMYNENGNVCYGLNHPLFEVYC